MSALQEALSKTVAELAKATVASADAIGVESLGELKKISAAAQQTATAAAQTKVAIDASSKADATNTTDLKASIDALNVNIKALHAQQMKSEKMAQLRWAMSQQSSVQRIVDFDRNLFPSLNQVLSNFMGGLGTQTPLIAPYNGQDVTVQIQDILEKLLGKRPSITKTSSGHDAIFYPE